MQFHEVMPVVDKEQIQIPSENKVIKINIQDGVDVLVESHVDDEIILKLLKMIREL